MRRRPVATVGGSPSLRLEPGRSGERIGHEQAGFLETTQTQFATALNSLWRPFQRLIQTLQADHLTITAHISEWRVVWRNSWTSSRIPGAAGSSSAWNPLT